jgi:hypothetical protein
MDDMRMQALGTSNTIPKTGEGAVTLRSEGGQVGIVESLLKIAQSSNPIRLPRTQFNPRIHRAYLDLDTPPWSSANLQGTTPGAGGLS